MARPGSLRLRPPVLLVAVISAVALAGCATAPSSGPPRRAPGGSSQVQAYVQPLPPPGPTSAWEPQNVVLGFLHASASYAFDAAAAQQYLVPALRKRWHPDQGPVAVVGAPTPTSLSAKRYIPQNEAPTQPNQQFYQVQFTGQRLATLTQTGQYQYTPGQNVLYQFILAKTDGVWLISQLPKGQPSLLLTQSDFESVYQPRNLFFLTPQQFGPAELVPDPVYAPLQSSNSALNTNLATGLVNGLLKGQGDWLSGATTSAFPRGIHLVKQLTITGRSAQVYLGGAKVQPTGTQIQLMAEQLLATLSDSSYSSPLANQLQLYIDNIEVYSSPPGVHTNLVPGLSPGPLFVVTGSNGVGDGVGELRPTPKQGAKLVSMLGPPQTGGASVTAAAASPSNGGQQQLAVAVQDGNGCAVDLKPGSQQAYRSYQLSQAGGQCASLSWDSNDNLWATAGQKVWVLRAQNRQPVAVSVAAIPAMGESGARLLALRMAPDAVRAALLVSTPAGNRLLLAAVRFHGNLVSLGPAVAVATSLVDPIAISWSDPYHLAVLASGGIFNVPLTNGAGQQPPGSPAEQGAQTLTTNGSELVVGTSQGEVFASSAAAPGWLPVGKGFNPIYTG